MGDDAALNSMIGLSNCRRPMSMGVETHYRQQACANVLCELTPFPG
jgi:hypothetical protein